MNESKNDNETWDLVIQPRYSLLDLRLRDVWRYRDLLRILVHRDFVSQYKQTILGPVWVFIQPLLTSLTFLVIFGRIAEIPVGGVPKMLFYLSGVVMWSYFSECLVKTSTVFKDNANIFGKVYFPRLIVPLSIVASNLMRFGVQLLLLIGVFVYYILFLDYAPHITWYILLVPVFIVLMAMLGLSMGMIISSMTTKYRDLAFLVTFGVQLFMYATPIVYPLTGRSEKAISILMLNPMAPIVEGVRKGLFNEGIFSWGYLGYTAAVTIVLFLISIVVFNRVEKSFVDTV